MITIAPFADSKIIDAGCREDRSSENVGISPAGASLKITGVLESNVFTKKNIPHAPMNRSKLRRRGAENAEKSQNNQNKALISGREAMLRITIYLGQFF